MFTCLRERHIHPINNDNIISSCVVGLLNSCRPITVLRLIVSIGVSALKSKSFGLIPHIKNEVFKLGPSFAKGNATPTVVCPFSSIFVGAASFHRRPNAVLTCSGFPVSGRFAFGKLFSKTPAASNQSSFESVHGGYFFNSAIANTFPVTVL